MKQIGYIESCHKSGRQPGEIMALGQLNADRKFMADWLQADCDCDEGVAILRAHCSQCRLGMIEYLVGGET